MEEDFAGGVLTLVLMIESIHMVVLVLAPAMIKVPHLVVYVMTPAMTKVVDGVNHYLLVGPTASVIIDHHHHLRGISLPFSASVIFMSSSLVCLFEGFFF